MKRTIILLTLLSFFAACASAPPVEAEPDWVRNYPVDTSYFIGIGSSDSGNRAEDQQRARDIALSNLAASISTKIQSEATILMESSTGEEYSESVTFLIEEQINQELQEVEIVDSYFSKTAGAWVYVRLSKAKWQIRQEQAIEALEGRSEDILGPLYRDAGRTVYSELNALSTVHNMLLESPYALVIRGGVEGKSGVLLDLIEESVSGIFQGLSLSGLTEELPVAFDGTLSLTVRIESDRRTGRLPMAILAEGGNLLGRFESGNNGEIEASLALPIRKEGAESYWITLLADEIGIDEKTYFRTIDVPSWGFLGRYEPLLAVFEFRGDADPAAFRGVLGPILPVKITESGSENRVLLEITYTDIPENEYGIFTTRGRGVLSIFLGEKIIYSWESTEIKEHGLNYKQAHDNLGRKLLEELKENREIAEGAAEALGL